MATQDDDLRGALESAFDSVEAPASEITETPIAATEPEVTAPAETPSAIDRSRDEKGRFAPKQEQAAPEVAAPEVQAPQGKKPPSSLKKEVLQEWEKLPPHVQDEFVRREADFHKGLEGYKTKAQFADAMQQAIAPFTPAMQQMGVTPEVAVSALLTADARLRSGQPQEKAAMLQQLVRDYRIDPATAVEAIAQMAGLDLGQITAEQPRFDPNVARLEAELNTLRMQQQYQQVARQQAEAQELNSSIEAFRSDPAHVHFDGVRAEMAALLQAGRAKDLQEAYDMAVWARPDIRQSLIEQQRKEAEDKARAEALAQRQKSAAVSVRGSPSGATAATTQGSLRDQLEAAFDKHA